MKTLLILLMPLFIAFTFIASNKLFIASDYCISAVTTIACLFFVSLWITAISSKKLSLH